MSMPIEIGLIEAEALLAIWLLSGLYPRGAWFAGLITFTLLAGVS